MALWYHFQLSNDIFFVQNIHTFANLARCIAVAKRYSELFVHFLHEIECDLGGTAVRGTWDWVGVCVLFG